MRPKRCTAGISSRKILSQSLKVKRSIKNGSQCFKYVEQTLNQNKAKHDKITFIILTKIVESYEFEGSFLFKVY